MGCWREAERGGSCLSVLCVSALRSHRDFPAASLLPLKGDHVVSVCLPARDEADTVGAIVDAVRSTLMRRVPLVDEILVMDDGSIDGTAAEATRAGARVVRTTEILTWAGPSRGKGDALWRGLHVARGDIVVFCDADLTSFAPHYVTGLLGPLFLDASVKLVKASYVRTRDGQPGEGGRVTELLARPLLELLFPDLAPIRQPLAGEFAARAAALRELPFVGDYGVDVALLIDVCRWWGPSAVQQVDLGSRSHRNRPLGELSAQARAVARTVLARAGAIDCDLEERPPLASVETQRGDAPWSELQPVREALEGAAGEIDDGT